VRTLCLLLQPPPRQGGRAPDDVVLREDVFLQKVRALGRRPVKKKAANDGLDLPGDDDGGGSEAGSAAQHAADAAWHVPSQQELAQQGGLAAVLQPSWKHNPNERRLTRSNRRG
jgi:hypothetical protein